MQVKSIALSTFAAVAALSSSIAVADPALREYK